MKTFAAWFALLCTLWTLTASAPANAQFGLTPQFVQLTAKQATGAAAAVTLSPSRGFALLPDAALGWNGAPGTGTDTQTFTYSIWLLGSYINASSNYFTLNGAYTQVSQNSSNCQPGNGAGGAAGACAPIFEEPIKFVASFNNSSGVLANSGFKISAGNNSCGALPPDQWIHVWISVDLSNLNRWAAFFNGVDMKANGCLVANTWDTSITYNMNSPIWLLNGEPQGSSFGSPSGGWYADQWVSHDYLGDASGTAGATTAANLAKFGTSIGGHWKAVDLGVQGKGPTGAQPNIYLHDNGDGVVINDGSNSAGAPAAVDSWLTSASNSPGTFRLFAAGYGPGVGATAHRPTLKFMPIYALGGATGTDSVTLDAGSITTSDYVIVAFIGFNSTGTRSPHCPPGLSSPFGVQLYNAVETNEQTEVLICGGFPSSGLVASPTLSVTWTTGAGNFTASSIRAMVYTNVNLTTPVDHAAGTASGLGTSSSNMTTPSGTVTQAQTLISGFFNWKSNTIRYDPPAGCNVTTRLPNNVSTSQMMFCDEWATSGSYQRTAVRRASPGNATAADQTLNFTLGLLGN